jgi:hypothetical protein
MRSRELAAALVAAVAMIGLSAQAADSNKAKKTAAVKKEAGKKSAGKKEAQDVAVDVAPPSGTWEGKPPPAEGYIWSTGYYAWKDGRYVWTAGEWVLDRPGFDYRQHTWVQRPDGKWTMTGGDWIPEKHAAGKD